MVTRADGHPDPLAGSGAMVPRFIDEGFWYRQAADGYLLAVTPSVAFDLVSCADTRRLGVFGMFDRMNDIDEFLSGLEPADREVIQHICQIVVGIVPEAHPGRSYGMAAYRAAGKPLLGFTASKAHLSMHPFSPAVVEAVADDLSDFSLSKGTVRFSAPRPVPDGVVERIVRLRMAEIML